MSYPVYCWADFGESNTGLTIHGKLLDMTGALVGSIVTSGIVESGEVDGEYSYTLSVPDGHAGAFVMYDSANTKTRRTVMIAPRETENADAKTSAIPNTAAIVAAIKAAAIMTGVSLEDVLRNLWSATVGDSDGDDPDDPTSVAYRDAAGNVDVTHALTDTTRRVTTA